MSIRLLTEIESVTGNIEPGLEPVFIEHDYSLYSKIQKSKIYVYVLFCTDVLRKLCQNVMFRPTSRKVSPTFVHMYFYLIWVMKCYKVVNTLVSLQIHN